MEQYTEAYLWLLIVIAYEEELECRIYPVGLSDIGEEIIKGGKDKERTHLRIGIGKWLREWREREIHIAREWR